MVKAILMVSEASIVCSHCLLSPDLLEPPGKLLKRRGSMAARYCVRGPDNAALGVPAGCAVSLPCLEAAGVGLDH